MITTLALLLAVNTGLLVVLAWAAVGLPLAWGVYRTALSVAKFFN